jgi:hypothetical protein
MRFGLNEYAMAVVGAQTDAIAMASQLSGGAEGAKRMNQLTDSLDSPALSKLVHVLTSDGSFGQNDAVTVRVFLQLETELQAAKNDSSDSEASEADDDETAPSPKMLNRRTKLKKHAKIVSAGDLIGSLTHAVREARTSREDALEKRELFVAAMDAMLGRKPKQSGGSQWPGAAGLPTALPGLASQLHNASQVTKPHPMREQDAA